MTTAVASQPIARRIGGGKSQPKPPGGGFSRDEILTKTEFLRRIPWGKKAWSTALNDGLKTIKQGGLVFVRGSDFWDFCERKAKARNTATATTTD